MSSDGPHPGLHKMQGQNDAEIYSGSLDKPLGSPFLRMSVVTSSFPRPTVHTFPV